MEKRCNICKQMKGASQFPSAATTRDRLDIYCTPCKKTAQATRYAENRRKAKSCAMLHRAKRRAKFKGLDFLITLADIEPIPDICPVLDLTLNWDRAGLPAGDSPSLDRIDNSLGYVPGNVMVISNRANMIKCDATAEEVQAVADWLNYLLQSFG